MLSLISCESTADGVVSIYEHGITEANNATTLEELHDITVDVKEKLTDLGNGFNGDKKMSQEETRKALNARQKFYSAVESAAQRIGR